MSSSDNMTLGPNVARPKVWRWCPVSGHGWYSEVEGAGLQGKRCDKCKIESSFGNMKLGSGMAGKGESGTKGAA